MKPRTLTCITAITLLAALAVPVQLASQPHHHYKLIDLETFGGPGSSPTEFQQVLNNRGMIVGGADIAELNPFPNCFNPFNNLDCYVQHAFVWQDGTLTDLQTLPEGSASFAYFVSDSGLIAGGSEDGLIDINTGTPEFHAVLWAKGEMKDLGTLGGTSSLGAQVNNGGQVVGVAQNAIPDQFSILGLGTQSRAFLWQSGHMKDLGTLGGPDAFAQIINESGQIAGVSYTSYSPDPNTGLPPLDPFLWENGEMQDLGNLGGTNGLLGPFIFGLNNRGEVIGKMALAGDQFFHAFLWNGRELSDLNDSSGALGGNFSVATGLNNAGEVVGSATTSGDQAQHAFLWRKGLMTDLGTLHGDPCSMAESINSRGQVVGASQSGCDFFTEAFLWENGGPSVDLNALIPPSSTLQLTGAFWINDRGEITGRGVPPGCGDVDNCGHAFILIPCDENHPGINDCDYSMVEESTTATVSTMSTTRPSPNAIRQLMRSLSRRRMHWYRASPQD